jgi:SepF-like predicted cell division protein (DUF552 family)
MTHKQQQARDLQFRLEIVEQQIRRKQREHDSICEQLKQLARELGRDYPGACDDS